MVKNGVPFDVAHALDEWELMAYAIAFAQHEDNDREWDWDRMTFIKRR